MTINSKRLIIAITGATGAVYGVRLLEVLSEIPSIETHLVVSDSGLLNLQLELEMNLTQLKALADVTHHINNVGASIASGSFQSDGMVVAPCSMRTLAAVAHGLSDNLITRAADVMLKERRKLILMVREAPFNLAHLRNMTSVTEMGGIVYPPLPCFYHRPQTIADIIDHTVSRVIDLLGISHTMAPRWEGLVEVTQHNLAGD
ncbi:MAG: UbiX family flavin prenyltransferase [Methylotenera sp.]|nr:UbiX family flavin prenyltransferase [Methylotenera sp.]MDP1754051.1 UbiX family flavin prenyltransferase [Methylotenera sp.]MDP1959343.1 UbiX family flavin prenyltransferase [Methylotenera sp.]MDP3944184.1 UbiX family flavin prenyltransferase [Methylotenera sp.]